MKKIKAADLITVILFIVVVFSFALGIFIKKQDEFSEQENRYLQQFPKIQSDYDGNLIDRIKEGKFLDKFRDGSFTSEISKFYADQFPLRDNFVGIKGFTEIVLLKGSNNDILIGEEDYLIKRERLPDTQLLQDNIDSLNAFSNALKDRNYKLYLAIAGSPITELSGYLDNMFDTRPYTDGWNYFAAGLESNDNSVFIDLNKVLKNKIEENRNNSSPEGQIIYRTDHHWTSFGAYYGYKEICEALGSSPYKLDEFTPEQVSDSFYGTSWSKAGMKWVKPDSMYYLRYDGDENFEVEIAEKNEIHNGFYDRQYLNKKDKYASFMFGNNGIVHVRKTGGNEKREKILLIKDSYAHSVVPLLARNYDITMVDLRYYKGKTISLLDGGDYDKVLVMSYFGSISDTTANSFKLLKYGL